METSEYVKRRKALRDQVKTGIILLCGNNLVPKNYAGNPLPFRQDSNFLYYLGIDLPGFLFMLDCDKDEEILFGDDISIDGQIWSGPQFKMQDLADQSGIKTTSPFSKLKARISHATKNNQKILYLPPYPADRTILLSDLLGKSIFEIQKNYSKELIRVVVSQRSVKSDNEIAQIEEVINKVTGPMHKVAMKMAFPGIHEYEIVAEMSKIVKENDLDFAYPPICSVHGEILHNEHHRNQLQEGSLLLIDAGAESVLHYASDITRTIPVGGKFSRIQNDIYHIVLAAEQNTISKIKPGVPYVDLHHEASLQITEGLKNLGLMKGDPEEAVMEGAHALFFPHGLGHMMGLDVHDMEDLGEDFVGYGEGIRRSEQFGTAYLRLARSLQPGFVLTVEPGIYFIPTLIEMWQAQKKFEQYINYHKLETYKKFGGIRIEDNILVEQAGSRVLGNPIPKNQHDIEEIMRTKR